MFTLEESLAHAEETRGADSKLAKNIRRQIENRDAAKGQSAARLFIAGAGPKLKELQGNE
jgi:hypothetical protein